MLSELQHACGLTMSRVTTRGFRFFSFISIPHTDAGLEPVYTWCLKALVAEAQQCWLGWKGGGVPEINNPYTYIP